MDIKLSQEDTEWLSTQYPKLIIDQLEKVITGEIDFTRSYEGYEISDSYAVKISLTTSGASMLPKVYDVSDKIADVANRYKMKLIDLHINSDGSFCLAIQDREHEFFTDGFNFQEFMLKALEPFFESWSKLKLGYISTGHLRIQISSLLVNFLLPGKKYFPF